MTNRITPLTPIFDSVKRTGTIAFVNGPPGVDRDFCYVVFNELDADPIWVICDWQLNVPSWPTLATAVNDDMGSEVNGEGGFWWDAFWQESGEKLSGAQYLTAWTFTENIWASKLDELNAVAWPTIPEAIADDDGSEINGLGGIWWDAYWIEGGIAIAPANYQDAVAFTGPIWSSDLTALNNFDHIAMGQFTQVGSFYYFTGPGAVVVGSLGPATIDFLELGGGGAGVYDFGSEVDRWGGGGAGQYRATAASSVKFIQIISIGTAGVIDFQDPGGNGGDTVTHLNTTVGGGGGGRFGVGEANGRDGGSGGGGGESPGLGGTGTAGNDGGDGGSGANPRGGGGGGAGAVGQDGGDGTGGLGGAGTTWLDGIEYARGGSSNNVAPSNEYGSGGSASATTTVAAGRPGVVIVRVL